MKSVNVKICGLKRKKDVELCLDLGVDILGFVVEYPMSVPWNMSRIEALPLLEMVKSKQGSSSSHKSCIVTGGSPKKVIELAEGLKPSLVQLHFNESFHDTVIITDELKKMNIGVIKTIPPYKADRISQFGTESLEIIVKKLCQTDVFALLADSRTPSNSSKRGTMIDIDLCKQIIKLSSKPVLIAGGINADNVLRLISLTGAGFVDIMTGVESKPGEKNSALLSGLMRAIISVKKC